MNKLEKVDKSGNSGEKWGISVKKWEKWQKVGKSG